MKKQTLLSISSVEQFVCKGVQASGGWNNFPISCSTKKLQFGHLWGILHFHVRFNNPYTLFIRAGGGKVAPKFQLRLQKMGHFFVLQWRLMAVFCKVGHSRANPNASCHEIRVDCRLMPSFSLKDVLPFFSCLRFQRSFRCRRSASRGKCSCRRRTQTGSFGQKIFLINDLN